jgi:hypothetical protein
MKIDRVWSMPSSATFTIKPIKELLQRYNVGVGWIDPFAGNYSPAEYTNDLNPNTKAICHKDAKEFLEGVGSFGYVGGLYDPPYSLRQIIECYDGFGMTVDKKWATTKFYTDTKNLLAKLIEPGGLAISFGWNSIGLGKKRGFEIIEILLVSHGRLHNDTIVTVERRLPPKGEQLDKGER